MNRSRFEGMLGKLATWTSLAAPVCAALVVVGAQKAQAGVNFWTSHGPYGGDVVVLAIDPTTPSTLYARPSRGGVFRSTNSGASWSAINGGLSNLDVVALAIDPSTPSTLYAGTWGGGVFKSSNSGASWNPVNSGLGELYLRSLAFDPAAPGTLYAGTRSGTFKTTDSGNSWAGTAGVAGGKLALDPLTEGTLYAFDGSVMKSVDGGANWINTGPDAPVISLAIDPKTPSTLYAGTNGSGVFQSTDGGASWSALNTGLTDTVGHLLSVDALVIDPATPSTLYAGTNFGVFQSSDSGTSWNAINNGMGSRRIFALVVDPGTPGTVYAATNGGGVFQSTDAGTNWTAVNTGLSTLPVRVLAIDPAVPSTVYAGSPFGVFKSTDRSTNWTAVNTGLPAPPSAPQINALVIDPTTPSTLYAGTAVWGVFQSTDSGASWSESMSAQFTLVPLGDNALAIDPATPSTLYAGTSGGVFQSTDSGITWHPSNFPGVPVFAPQTPTTLYALGGGLAGVFQSTDSGARWVQTGQLPLFCCSNGPVTLVVDPATPSTLYVGTYDSGVFKSTDAGSTWHSINLGLPSARVDPRTPPTVNVHVIALAIDPRTPTTVYAATDAGVFDIEQVVLPKVVGTGTADSCTEAALDAALDGGGSVTFKCGGPATITLSSAKIISRDTTVDGGGLITLSGDNTVGVFSVNAGVPFVVENLTIAKGHAVGGGVIDNRGGAVTVTNSTFTENSATVINNVTGGTMTIANSTFSANSAGAISNGSPGFLGAPATATVTNCTLAGNTGSAGIYNFRGSVAVTNTILAANAGGNCSGITDGGHNLDDGTICFNTANGSLSNTDPRLDPAGLQDNGGPTHTIALLADSPAIDAGDETVCAAAPVNSLDQRGFGRPGAGHANCSIGAFEYEGFDPPLPTATPSPLPTSTPTLHVACAGDCDGNGSVSVDELITLVNIALGDAQALRCAQGIPSGPTVDVVLIVRAVNAALEGCRK